MSIQLTLRARCLVAVLLVACGRRDAGNQAVSRDSSGVVILAYPASAWDLAPAWTLSERPIVILGGDSADATMDPSTAVAATILGNGRSVVYTTNPAELLLFDAAGSLKARMGAPGDGPGEYQSISPLLQLGGDTVFAFDATQRKGLLFAANGRPLGEHAVPAVVSPVPMVLHGRLSDGTFVLSLDMVSDTPPSGSFKTFRNRMFVLGLRGDSPHYDTLLVTKGAELVPSTMMVGGQVTPIAKPLIFGASTQIAVGGNRWYISAADRPEIEARDSAGKLLLVVQLNLPDRPVGPTDQEKYKATVREAYDRMTGLVSPEVVAAELNKLDGTMFADHLPVIAQLMADREGNLWINRGFSLIDNFRSWLVLNPEGQLVGRVATPLGSVLAIAGDRIVVRRKNLATSKVRLEVYRLTRIPTKPNPR